MASRPASCGALECKLSHFANTSKQLAGKQNLAISVELDFKRRWWLLVGLLHKWLERKLCLSASGLCVRVFFGVQVLCCLCKSRLKCRVAAVVNPCVVRVSFWHACANVWVN